MAQADTIPNTTTRGFLSDAPGDSARHAYFGLEDGLHDLFIMAKIASEQAYTCVGKLRCVDGEPIESPTGQDVQAVMFATSHVVGMLKKLLDDYERGFEDIRLGLVR